LFGYGYESLREQVERLALMNASDKCLRDLPIKSEFSGDRGDLGQAIYGGKEREDQIIFSGSLHIDAPDSAVTFSG
jgi:hypothetical protein